MGIVIKQSFWGTTFAYIGVIIGYINTLLLKPYYLDIGQIGLMNLVVSNALMLAPFVTLGMPATLVRYFTYLQDDKSLQRRFYSFQFTLILIANILLGVLLYIGLDWIKEFFEAKSQLYNQFIHISFLIVIFYSFYLQIQAYSRVVLDIIFPSALKEIFLRIGTSILILLFGFNFFNFSTIVNSLVIPYCLVLILMIWYFTSRYDFKPAPNIFRIPRKWFVKLYQFSTYTLANSIALSVYFNISFLLLAILIGLEANGVFTTCFYIGIIIEMPRRSMAQITGPILAMEFKNNNLKNVHSLYQRSSITLGVIGILMLLGIICNLDDLFLLIPKGSKFVEGYWVVIAIGVAKVVDMLFGLNSNVLAFSNYYKYNVYFLIITAFILVIVNLMLIPFLGINGAAIAFLFSTIVFNLLKHFFIKRKIKIHLFSYEHLKLTLIAIVLTPVFYILPLTELSILNIIIKSILITLIYLWLIYRLGISEDINNWIRTFLKDYFNIRI